MRILRSLPGLSFSRKWQSAEKPLRSVRQLQRYKRQYLGAIQASYMFPDDSASKSEAEEGEQREDDDEAAETTTKRKNSLQKSSHRIY